MLTPLFDTELSIQDWLSLLDDASRLTAPCTRYAVNDPGKLSLCYRSMHAVGSHVDLYGLKGITIWPSIH